MLKNPLVVENIIKKSKIKSTDVVLEIGPGTGNLTTKLLEVAKMVIAIEIDPRMAAELQKRITGTPFASKLRLLMGDFMKVELPYFDVCVANTPYQISSPLVFKLLAHRPAFRCAVLMFQREFALRLIAQPSEPLYCRLSVNTQLLAKVTHLIKVGRNSFRPPPKVDSSVIRLKPKNPPPKVNFVEWDGLVKLAFGRKNKTLGSIFKNKGTIKLLEDNYRTLQAIKSGLPSLEHDQFKEKLFTILRESGFAELRGSKMPLSSFENLLDILNANYMFFSAEGYSNEEKTEQQGNLLKLGQGNEEV